MDQKQLCPNCGADMRIQSFVYVCDFCGTRVMGDSFSTVESLIEAPEAIEKRSSYIKKNRCYIDSASKISIEECGNTITLSSDPSFYANDGKYNKVLSFSLSYEFTTNGIEDNLFLKIKTLSFASLPQLSILIDMEVVITPRFEKWEGDIAFFKIDIVELQSICDSHMIKISSDIMEYETSIFDELIPYSCRFYHYSFDKRKYIYSIHRNLITD